MRFHFSCKMAQRYTLHNFELVFFYFLHFSTSTAELGELLRSQRRQELTLRLWTNGGESQEDRKSAALWEDWA